MTPEQVTTVLLMVAAAEGRPADEAQVAFWMATLSVHQVTEEEFRWAVIRHYATSTYPIKPGHVWQLVDGRRGRERIERSLEAEIKRSTRFALAERAEASGDWTEFDARYPGFRRAAAERELDFWSGRNSAPPPLAIERARELGIDVRKRAAGDDDE